MISLKLIYFVFNFLVVLVAGGDDGPFYPPVEFYYRQTLDHFNARNNGYFNQRYLFLDKFWKSDGPIFFYTGNEGDIWEFYNNTGALFQLADKYNGLAIFAEHRYYGTSLPFLEKSWELENIGYLSPDQALADYAELITSLKETLVQAKNSPVVTVGGSYGGSLSAYMRMRFPDVVDIAFAASAPILLYPSETNSNAFMKKITEDFTAVGCAQKIRDSFEEILSISKQPNGYSKIQKELNLCYPPKSQKDIDNINYWARNSYVVQAMLNYPYPTNFGSKLPAWPVNASCQVFSNSRKSLLQQFSESVGIYYNGSQTLDCFNISAEFYVCSDASGCGGSKTDPSAMSWDYEACTEIIHNIGVQDIEVDMFPKSPWSLNNLNDYCWNKWQVYPRPNWMPLNTHIKTASNILYSNGMLDPWSVGGVLTAPNSNCVAITIKDSAHHLDLRANNPADPPSVTEARKFESTTIGNWLNKIYQEKLNTNKKN